VNKRREALSAKVNTGKFTGLRAETPARRNFAKTTKPGGTDFACGVLFVTLLAAAMAKQAADMPAEGILNRVTRQQCKFGGHAQHTAAPYAFVEFGGHAQHTVAPYAFVDGTGAFFRTRACSSTVSRARIRDGGLRLTTVAGGPTTTGTQILSSTFPRGPVELVGLR